MSTAINEVNKTGRYIRYQCFKGWNMAEEGFPSLNGVAVVISISNNLKVVDVEMMSRYFQACAS